MCCCACSAFDPMPRPRHHDRPIDPESNDAHPSRCCPAACPANAYTPPNRSINASINCATHRTTTRHRFQRLIAAGPRINRPRSTDRGFRLQTLSLTNTRHQRQLQQAPPAPPPMRRAQHTRGQRQRRRLLLPSPLLLVLSMVLMLAGGVRGMVRACVCRCGCRYVPPYPRLTCRLADC